MKYTVLWLVAPVSKSKVQSFQSIVAHNTIWLNFNDFLTLSQRSHTETMGNIVTRMVLIYNISLSLYNFGEQLDQLAVAIDKRPHFIPQKYAQVNCGRKFICAIFIVSHKCEWVRVCVCECGERAPRWYKAIFIENFSLLLFEM